MKATETKAMALITGASAGAGQRSPKLWAAVGLAIAVVAAAWLAYSLHG